MIVDDPVALCKDSLVKALIKGGEKFRTVDVVVQHCKIGHSAIASILFP